MRAWAARSKPPKVSVGGDLCADGGISGKGKGRCCVSGATYARYVTNATVESKGNLTAQSEISNSNIVCGGDVKIESGPLIAGHATIVGSLDCLSLGTLAGTRTTVEVGVDEYLRRLANASLPEIERLKRKATEMRNGTAPLLKIQKSLSSRQKEQVTELLFEAETLEEQAGELEDALRKRWEALQHVSSRR